MFGNRVFRGPRLLLAALLCWGCQSTGPQPFRRVELRKISGDVLELSPIAGMPPYCMVFSISQSGVIRQLTMNVDNTSVPCEPGKVIGGQRIRVVPPEGKLRIYTIFSDQELSAEPIAAQIHEMGREPNFSVLDLRAPGRVVTDVIEFTPDPAP